MELAVLVLFSPVLILLARVLFWRLRPQSGTVGVVVLGDVGRSPRMQYHALSFADAGFRVDLIGLSGSAPLQKLTNHSQIEVVALSDLTKWIEVKFLPKLLRYVIKTLIQLAQLLVILLFYMRRPKQFLVQNSPAIPTLFALHSVAFLCGSHVVVDWHNYSYTILQMALRPGHPLVRIARIYEQILGRFARSNLCVTRAMREDLKKNWNIEALTVYDRPPEMFKKTPLDVKHDLFVRLSKKYQCFRSQPWQNKVALQPGTRVEETVFTRKENGGIELRSDRPFLLLSSTSWTEDEDFSILLNAIEKYESFAKEGQSHLPSLLCVITGKGPQKKYYEELMSSKEFERVTFCLPWLEAEDYPLLLGSADLGVCLHKSSSGFDLPMKVVDMFGCGLPVCAIDFNCLHELVRHGVNGLVFRSAQDLSSQIQRLARDFPASHSSELDAFRANLKYFQSARWNDNWNRTVLPLFEVK
ncbi:chitobiosyldiphosphodolichol beta-mannosyltransferase-like [Oscarella lobularis]|uniref:chitobiosyldiphosphodolichol beta-mannosyltransferase-like n=1 Tax=Oscarella lobularis TaxID=121494 RepID=UPI00331363A2